MTITFYSIKNDRIEVSKKVDSTTKIKEATAHYKDDTDVLDPVFEVEYDALLVNCNYIYVSDWNRYYFVNGITTGAHRLYFHCHVDVLQTYKTDLLELTCVIARQEHEDKSNGYLNDAMWRNLQYKKIVRYVFEESFDDTGDYVLAVCGES